MNCKPQDIMRKEILMREFVCIEIAKRHVEEYDENSINIIKSIRKKFFSKFNNVPHHIFIIGISQSLDMYNLQVQGLSYYVSKILDSLFKDFPEVDFRESEIIRDYIEVLLPISKKYDVLAPDILYPIDMKSIIDSYNSNYCPPAFYRFSNNKKDSFHVTKDSGEIAIIPIKGSMMELDVDDMKYQCLIDKIVNNKGLSVNEQEFINIYEKSKTNDKFRIDSFIKLIFGMLSWDTIKKGGTISDVFNIYATFLKRTSPKQCNASCLNAKHGCKRRQTCDKFIRESFRIASLNIRCCTLLPSKTKGSAVKPKNPPLVQRYQISCFANGDFPFEI